MTRRIIEPVTVWDGETRVYENGAILIEDDRVGGVFSEQERAGLDRTAYDERIDGEGRLAIPGLINSHTHLYSSLARGMAIPDYSPKTFTQILEGLWWRLDKGLDRASVRASALVGAIEAARCGITTMIDHHASPNAIEGSLEIVKECVSDSVGLRGAFCYEVSDRDGMDKARAGIDENLRFLSSATGDPASTALFGLHASFTLSDETLERVAAVIPEGAGIHIHVAEGPEDEVECERKYGMRIIERLDRFGLLRKNSILAHCLHLDEGEKDLLAERGSIVVHNPRSNMNNAVGTFDLPGYSRRNVLIGLGTDGLGANMLAELFTAAILQKHATGDPLAAPFPVLFDLLFSNNRKIVNRVLGIDVGLLAPRYPADIALIDYLPPTPLDPDNLLGHLLFGLAVHSLRVTDLFVVGQPIIRGGRFVEIDEEAEYALAREEAKRLWERIV